MDGVTAGSKVIIRKKCPYGTPAQPMLQVKTNLKMTVAVAVIKDEKTARSNILTNLPLAMVCT